MVTVIKSEIVETASGAEVHPVIPFSEFPSGIREAGPDADGNLVWTVYSDKSEIQI